MTEVKHTPDPARDYGDYGHWDYGDPGPRRPYFSDVYWPGVLHDATYVCALFVVALVASAFLVYWAYSYNLKPPDQALAEAGIGSSAVFDRSGMTHLYQFSDPLHGVRNPVSLDQISPYLVGATIATEDPSFYRNPGVNFRGLARAGFENLTPFGPGFFAGSGGSSISQQLARNVYVDPAERSERSIARKMKETVIALELKKRYSDDEILEWYLNQVYYGNSAYGAEAASQRYFGKSSAELTLAEAALLAGLPQYPAAYSPAVPENQERAKGRQLQVLDLMVEHARDIEDIVKVTPEEIEAARQAPINYAANQFDVKAPHFVFYVEDQVAKMCAKGLFEPPKEISCDNVVGLGGLRITTSLDFGLQQLGERILEEELARTEEASGGHNGSIVAIHPETGQILAYVGSRAYFREDISGQVDIASSLQSHGSSMKAFTYLEAFEQGWVPATFIEDKPLTLVEGDPSTQVNNWNSKYLGKITVRKAISESVNTAAVRTVMEVGVDPMRATAQRVGITDLQADTCGPAITLGGCEVKLVDMTYAYSTFANNGLMRGRPSGEQLPDGFRQLDPVSVLKIEDAVGEVLYEFTQPEERPVTEPAYAYMLTDVLSKEAISWSQLKIDRPAAAKTGTSEEFTDNVLMGYTRDIALGVWVGNADDTPMAPGTFSGANSGPIWKRFMQEGHALLQLPPRPFEKPADVTTRKCGNVTEVFKGTQKPSKPSACNPGGDSGPARSPAPAPEATPAPTPDAGTPVQTAPPATAAPSAEPTSTPEASATPVESPAETATPEATPGQQGQSQGGGGGPGP